MHLKESICLISIFTQYVSAPPHRTSPLPHLQTPRWGFPYLHGAYQYIMSIGRGEQILARYLLIIYHFSSIRKQVGNYKVCSGLLMNPK